MRVQASQARHSLLGGGAWWGKIVWTVPGTDIAVLIPADTVRAGVGQAWRVRGGAWFGCHQGDDSYKEYKKLHIFTLILLEEGSSIVVVVINFL